MKSALIIMSVILLSYIPVGSIIAQPRIEVDPVELDPFPWEEENVEFEVSIRNVGDEVLRFDISVLFNRGEDWLTVQPLGGNVAPGSESYIVVALIRRNMGGGDYTADIHVLNNDPNNADVVVRYHVELAWSPIIISLQANWNLVSSHYQLTQNDIVDIFSDISQALIIIKDGQGRFYSPADDFNNIPFWDFHQGYFIKMYEEAELWLNGEPAPEDTPIPLGIGWNMVAYFPEAQLEAPTAFRNIQESLIIAKDGEGHFYIPAHNFNNMPPLIRGRGYQVKVVSAVDLIWFVP
jgi:hypothetical protein